MLSNKTDDSEKFGNFRKLRQTTQDFAVFVRFFFFAFNMDVKQVVREPVVVRVAFGGGPWESP